MLVYNTNQIMLLGTVIFGVTASVTAVVLFFDNRKLKEIQKELYKSRERYRMLFEYAPDSTVVHRDGVIIKANAKAVSILGAKSKEELIGRNIESFNLDNTNVRNIIVTDLRSSGNASFRQKMKRLDDKIINTEVCSILIPFDKEKVRLAVLRPVSDRQSYMEKIELDKLKTEFFSNISHELRTPLNLILSTAQVLDSKKEDMGYFKNKEHIEKYMHIITKNCYRLIKLINNLIDITEINSGYYKICLENQNIVSLVEGVCQEVASSVVQKGITVLFDTDVEDKMIACDHRAIERIILNLLSNAIKFSRYKGQIIVSIYDNGDKVTISVKDDGIGIPDDESGLVFDNFRQVDKLFTRRREGSGVGLSLVKSLVEMHNGRIQLKTEYGKGSEFIVELPVYTVPEQHPKINSRAGFGKSCSTSVNIEFSDIQGVVNI